MAGLSDLEDRGSGKIGLDGRGLVHCREATMSYAEEEIRRNLRTLLLGPTQMSEEIE